MFSRLGGALATTAKRVAAAGGAAIVAAGAVGLSTAARMEQAEIGFTTMLGSGEKARVFLGELSAFAAKTPFEFPELQTAASSLVSAGIEADKVIPIMTTLGDVTSGMGTGSEGIKRATIALQQMNAAGRITGEDLNQLRDAGIPVYDLLANATGKSKEEVVKLAQAGKLGKTELDAMMRALETGGGLEKFTGLMAQQSQSLTGMWSTLKDTFSVGMAEAIQPLIPLIKEGLGGATSFLADNMPRLRDGLTQAVAAVRDFVGGADPDKTARFGEAVGTARAAVGDLRPALQDAAAALPSLNDAVSVGGAVLGFLADHLDTVIAQMPLLIAAFVAYKVAQAASNVAAIAAVPVQVALAISNIASASANRALAAAIAQQTVAQNVGTVSTARGTVATIAGTVAGIAASAAAKAMTAAQWLLNAALTANPIGLVIVAIAALVAAFVLAWKHSETFRTVVVGALNGVKNVTLSVVGGLVEAWFWWADKVLFAAEKAMGWIPGIGGKIKTARDGMAAVAGAIQGEIDKLKGKDIELGVKANGSWSMSAARAANEHANRRAAGGPIAGPGTGTSDSIPAVGPGGAPYRLSNGEHVWTAAEVAALGGHQAMVVLRGAVARGEVRAYATGGAVGTRMQPGTAAVARQAYGDVEHALLSAIAAEAARKAAAAQAEGGMLGGGPGGAMGWQRQMAALRAVFPGLALNSGYRPGSITATGNRSYHAQGRAVDVPPRIDVFDWIRANYGRGTKELIFSPAGGRQVHNGSPHVYTGITKSMHYDHVHWAMDQGGVARGVGMMPKLTSRPERVLSPRQTESFERLVDSLDRGPTTAVLSDRVEQLLERIANRPVQVMTPDGKVLFSTVRAAAEQMGR